MTGRILIADDRGVSTTVGAILLVAIGIIALVNVRTEYVPVWQGGAEASHMRLVESQLSTMKSDLERASSNRTSLLAPYPITLSQPRTGMFSQTDPFDRLQFVSRPDTLTYAAPRITIQERDGTNLAALGETWTDAASGQTINEVESITNFRLRLDQISAPVGPQNATVSIYDADSEFAGSFTLDVRQSSGPDFHVVFTVRDAFNNIIYEQPDAIFQGTEISPYWVDLLDPTFPFDPLVRSTAPPLTITLDLVGLTGDYTITYSTTSANGESILVGAGGLEVNDYNKTRSAGAIVYEGRNVHFVDQTFILEHGALILDQDDGRVMRVEPLLLASESEGVTTVTLSLPTFVGGASTISGEATSTVFLRTVANTRLVGTAPGFNLTVPTDYPELWTDFFDRKFAQAGLVGTGEMPGFSLAASLTDVRVNLLGSDPDPLSSVHDVQLILLQSQVEVSLAS